MDDKAAMQRILELARWAPSGDNTQPWRFEIVDARRLVVHGFDTRDQCIYDLDGRASQISLGALLETIVIAATAQCWHTQVSRDKAAAENTPTFHIAFTPSAKQTPSPLLPYILTRSVHRYPMHQRALSDAQKQALETCLEPGYRVLWLERLAAKFALARIMSANALFRLTLPEAYAVHRAMIEWHARESRQGIPDEALGVGRGMLALMQWALADWRRMDFLNRYAGGTWLPRLRLDILPSLRCGAHFVLLAPKAPTDIDDYVDAGRMLQRFWLALTGLGLLMQPEATPLIFSRYARDGLVFTTVPGMLDKAVALAAKIDAAIGRDNHAQTVFMGRIGIGAVQAARSTRLDLADLMRR
jgi:sulfur-carrier protein adenylyltransferase/sulfurtransferase